MESERWLAWTPSERLVYLRLMDEANERSEAFYRSDYWLAAELGISERTIRQARRKAVEAGWLLVEPGFRDKRGRGVATRYVDVKWATVPDRETFSKMDRWAFRTVVDLCSRRSIAPADVIVYVTLAYWLGRHEQRYLERGEFFIAKADLRRLSGLADAPQRVKRLYERFRYSDGSHLFEYSGWQQLRIRAWATPMPPDAHPKSLQIEQERIQRVRQAAAQRRGRAREGVGGTRAAAQHR